MLNQYIFVARTQLDCCEGRYAQIKHIFMQLQAYEYTHIVVVRSSISEGTLRGARA